MNRVTLCRRALLPMVFSGLIYISAASAFAQTLPPAADPSRLHPKPSGLSLPDTIPAAPAAPKQESRVPGDIYISGAEQISFLFKGVEWDGMTSYPSTEFDGLFSDLAGKTVALSTVIERINSVAHRYHEDGYILTQLVLPEQDITAGRVKVTVIEGKIAQVSFDKPSATTVYLSSYLDQISNVSPFHIPSFEQKILLLNQLPGASFKSVLRLPTSPTTRPGDIDVALIEEKNKTGSNFEISNDGSRYAGPWQAAVTFSDTSLFLPYDETSLKLAVTNPAQELKSGDLSYQAPIYAVPGLFLTASASYGKTEAGASLRELGIHGISREASLGLRLNHLLSRSTNWVSEANFSVKNINSKILGTQLYDDKTRVASLTTTVQHLDSYRGVSLISLQFAQGLDILGARETGSENLSRADGQSNFRKISVQISRVQDLPLQFQGLVQINGQYSLSRLLSSEEFGFGGRSIGRGLDPSELTGDHGAALSVELRYNGLKPLSFLSLQPYTFFDVGKVWQKGVVAGNSVSAVTAGLGGRLSLPYDFSIDAYAAIPLTYAAQYPQVSGNSESPRYLLFITKRF